MLPWTVTKLSFYCAMAIWDVGETMLIAATTAFAADVTCAELRGTQTSLLNQMQDVTFAVMPIFLGSIAAARGNAIALRVASGCMLASSMAVLKLLRKTKS